MKSRAVARLGRRIGGVWAVLGGLLRLVPALLADWGYDLVAAARHRLFAKPEGACPLVPLELRGRFLP